VAWLLALAVSPLLLSRGRAVFLLAGTEAAVLATVFVPASVNPRPWDAPVSEALAILLAWGAGESVRVRVESRVHRAETAEQVRVLQKSEAIARGRAEVARELHDVVAHHVSLIAVRAATAPYQLKDLSPEAGQTLLEIAAQARTALEELRAVLGILRAPDGQVLHAPQPTLAQLPDLLDRMRATGMVILATTEGAARVLPENIELCCYRIVQEALTNAARHAPGVVVKVTLSYLDEAFAIGVSNPVAAVALPPGQAGSGYGLTGMRERVAALGGTFHAAPCETSFRVEARIPLTAASDGR
jgi:signal transduction histidine kinase